MTTLPRILVTGAGGKTGSATVRTLLEHPEVRVRAMVRSEDHRANALREAGAEVVVGNMDDVRDMHRAMHDVQRAYFVAPFTNNSLDQAMNFAIAADEARLEHVVALGQWLSSPSHPAALTRRTWLIDQMMTWIPGVDHTVINVGWFADNYISLLSIAAQFGILPMPIGDGTNAPIADEDIGRVVAGVLIDPSPYAGRTLRPTGPELLSPQQVADAFGDALGRKVRYMELSDPMLSKTLRVLGMNPFQQAQGLNYVREYRRGSFEFGAPSDVVQQVTGHPAEDLTSILRRYAASDPTARRSLRNTLSAMWLMLRTILTPPMNVKNWEAEKGMPYIDHAEDCADSIEWKDTHTAPDAYWVIRNESAAGTGNRRVSD